MKKQPKIMLVSENYSSFYKKYVDNLVVALLNKQIEVLLLLGEFSQTSYGHDITKLTDKEFTYLASQNDEHRFMRSLTIAHDYRVDRIHFCRIYEPTKLYLALKTEGQSDILITGSIFGLARLFRFPIYARYFEKLLSLPCIKSILLHSIHPKSMVKAVRDTSLQNRQKITYVHDPIYDDFSYFSLSKRQARQNLNIALEKYVVLFFGRYFLSKGPDILLNVAARTSDDTNVLFLFVGETSSATFDFHKEDYASYPNVRFDDRFVDNQQAAQYLVASDLIVLPYRHYYKYNTSGIVVQACLAKRPILVPNITPFKQIINQFGVGKTFSCESQESLKKQIRWYVETRKTPRAGKFKLYLSHIERWDRIADYIMKDKDFE